MEQPEDEPEPFPILIASPVPPASQEIIAEVNGEEASLQLGTVTIGGDWPSIWPSTS